MRVLIFHAGALGDCLGILPALNVHRSNFSSCTYTFLGQGAFGTFLCKTGIIQNAYNFNERLFSSLFQEIPSDAIGAFLMNFDQAIIFTEPDSLFVSNVKKYIPVTFAHAPFPTKDILVYRYHRAALAHFFNVQDTPIAYPLISIAGATQPRNAPIAIHPGSGSLKKNWPLNRFLDLAQQLRINSPISWVIGYAEESLVERLPNSDIILCDLDLWELASSLVQARLYIGNDSGIAHLAAALGLPSTVLFGPSNALQFSPCGNAVTIVQADEALKDSSSPRAAHTMKMISIKSVLEICRQSLF